MRNKSKIPSPAPSTAPASLSPEKAKWHAQRAKEIFEGIEDNKRYCENAQSVIRYANAASKMFAYDAEIKMQKAREQAKNL